MAIGTKKFESYTPPVRYNQGLYTALPITTTGTLTANRVVQSGGSVRSIISGSGATVTLTAAQSGSMVLMDRAAGIVFTLPAPVAGYQFDFLVTTTVTSNTYKVITDTGTTLIAGSALMASDNLASKSFLGNGTTHISIIQNSASSNATGGIIGSFMRLTCVSSTLWIADCQLVASATPTTPFSTS